MATTIELSNDTPNRLSLYSTRHYPDVKSVFFSVHRGEQYVTTVSFTPNEARAFGQMLIDEADRIEKVGKKS